MTYKTILRHHLATLAFRTNYAIKDAHNSYFDFSAGQGVRPPGEILLHVVQMIKAVDDILNGIAYTKIEIDGWENIKNEFHLHLKSLDNTIENLENPDEDMVLKLYQGPLSDATEERTQRLDGVTARHVRINGSRRSRRRLR